MFATRKPAAAVPFEIMKTAFSFAATRPDCASAASPPSVLALVMNCRSEPCPVLFVFTTASKFQPKSTPVTSAALTVTGAKAWALPEPLPEKTPVVVFRIQPAAAFPASAVAGSWPPT